MINDGFLDESFSQLYMGPLSNSLQCAALYNYSIGTVAVQTTAQMDLALLCETSGQKNPTQMIQGRELCESYKSQFKKS